MTDAGYYRGTTADQDTRFQDKQKKLLKTLKFSDVLAEPVDMRKVYKEYLNESNFSHQQFVTFYLYKA